MENSASSLDFVCRFQKLCDSLSLASLPRFLSKTLDLLGEVPGIERSIIALKENSTLRIVAFAGKGEKDFPEEVPSSRHPLWMAFSEEKIVSTSGSEVFGFDAMVSPKTLVLVACPIQKKPSPLGVLYLESSSYPFPLEIEIVELLAGYLASRIALTRAREKEERKTAHLRLLREIGQEISGLNDPNQILWKTVWFLQRVLDYYTVSVAVVEGSEMVFKAAVGSDRQPILTADRYRLKIGRDGIIGWVAFKGKSLNIPDVKEEPRFFFAEEIRECRSELAVPLISGGKVLGVLDVQSKRRNAFGEEDVELLESISAQLASILERSYSLGSIEFSYKTLVKELKIELSSKQNLLNLSHKELVSLYGQLEGMTLSVIVSLARALEARDPYTKGHSQRVCDCALLIVRGLGLPAKEKRLITTAALLHDIGKIGISDRILLKPTRLTDSEYRAIRAHPVIGAEICKPIKFLQDVLPLIRHHHESWNGTGYPDGLRGEEIPFGARIIGVADTFDALTSSRPYKKPHLPEEAILMLKKMSGDLLDPGLVNVFIKEQGKALAVHA